MVATPAVVVTVSDRCASGAAQDRSGPAAAALLEGAGYAVTVRVIPDGVDEVRRALRTAIAEGARLVVTTGGTGIGPRDLTPEATLDVVDRVLPGIPEAIRAAGAAVLPTAVLSRGVAGTIGRTLVVNAPGSPGGVTDALAVVIPLVPHVLSQLDGGDHG